MSEYQILGHHYFEQIFRHQDEYQQFHNHYTELVKKGKIRNLRWKPRNTDDFTTDGKIYKMEGQDKNIQDRIKDFLDHFDNHLFEETV